MSKSIKLLLILVLLVGATACSGTETQPETVEEALVEEVAEDSAFACYWLDPDSNAWVSMDDLTTEEACVEMDSCSGGGGLSDGGCYAWSDEPPTVEESAAGTSNVTEQPPTSSSVMIVAADGGTITTAGATLEISPDALAADTTISMDASSAPSSLTDVTGQLFTFGPTGTQFSPSATLSLPLSASVPEGKRAVLAYVDGSTLTNIAGSSQTGDVVTGLIEHFSQVTVRYIRDISCEGASFKSCGGDITGTWTNIAVCVPESDEDRKALEEWSPLSAPGVISGDYDWGCTEVVLEHKFEAPGTWTFNSGLQWIDQTREALTHEVKYPAACFSDESLGHETLRGLDSCTDLGQIGDFATQHWSCTGSKDSEGCVCRRVDPWREWKARLNTYRTDGNRIFLQEPGAQEDSFDYCVDEAGLYVGELGGNSLIFTK